jgi:hypothetical protein
MHSSLPQLRQSAGAVNYRMFTEGLTGREEGAAAGKRRDVLISSSLPVRPVIRGSPWVERRDVRPFKPTGALAQLWVTGLIFPLYLCIFGTRAAQHRTQEAQWQIQQEQVEVCPFRARSARQAGERSNADSWLHC